jgi:hypothetical protein
MNSPAWSETVKATDTRSKKWFREKHRQLETETEATRDGETVPAGFATSRGPTVHEPSLLGARNDLVNGLRLYKESILLLLTIPKRLRIYFRFERRLLGELARAAARTVITLYRTASGRPDGVPGVVGAIQTFGQLAHL